MKSQELHTYTVAVYTILFLSLDPWFPDLGILPSGVNWQLWRLLVVRAGGGECAMGLPMVKRAPYHNNKVT